MIKMIKDYDVDLNLIDKDVILNFKNLQKWKVEDLRKKKKVK